MTAWAERVDQLSPPAAAFRCSRLYYEYYSSGIDWLEAMIEALEMMIDGHDKALRRRREATRLSRVPLKALAAAPKELGRLSRSG